MCFMYGAWVSQSTISANLIGELLLGNQIVPKNVGKKQSDFKKRVNYCTRK